MSFLKLQIKFINNFKTSYKKTKKFYLKNHLDVITLTISYPTILPSKNCNQNNFTHLPFQTHLTHLLFQTHLTHLPLQIHKFLHFKRLQTFQQQQSNTPFLCKLYTQNLLEIIITLIIEKIKVVFLHKTYPCISSLSVAKPFPSPNANQIEINATFLSLQNIKTCFFPFHCQMQ